ncbi:MAG: hypothetical protein EBZ18_01680 [Alphaproteobacteria bacterium]|nr:hypothetical protein [Alphaproteobacteria bacterium]
MPRFAKLKQSWGGNPITNSVIGLKAEYPNRYQLMPSFQAESLFYLPMIGVHQRPLSGMMRRV